MLAVHQTSFIELGYHFFNILRADKNAAMKTHQLYLDIPDAAPSIDQPDDLQSFIPQQNGLRDKTQRILDKEHFFPLIKGGNDIYVRSQTGGLLFHRSGILSCFLRLFTPFVPKKQPI
jgi:hypothetical protein